MSLFHILVLALIQGLTEFLPVSSSAHLILGSRLLDWPDQGLVFDVATHLGTLLAVLVYFRSDLTNMLTAWLRPVASEQQAHDRNLGRFLVLASIPVILAGGLAHDWVEHVLRDVRVIAVSTIVFGLLLWAADAFSRRDRELRQMNLRAALLIGLAQALALVPGTSRSGITITAGRMLGFGAEAAARFSFLLAIPVIGAAGGYGILRMIEDNAGIHWDDFLLAVGAAAVAGWVCIAVFLALLKRVGLLPFVIYRLLLGVVLWWVVS